MNSSKAVKILLKFSPAERKAFRKYLRSPFFNTNPTLVSLYDLLERVVLEKGKILTEEKAARKLSPQAPISINLLRKLKTALLEQVLGYLSHSKLEAEANGLKWRLALAELNRLEALEDFPKHYRQATKPHSKAAFQSANTLEDRYHIEIQHGHYRNRLGNRQRGTYLDELHQHLDQSYLLRKLRLACLSLNQGKIIQQASTLAPDESFFELFERRSHVVSPLVRIYLLLRKCLSQQNSPEEYAELKKLVQENHTSIPPTELPDILTMILNHCARQVNRGNLEFREETFLWYRWLLENGFLFDQGEILPQHAKNIVTLAAQTGKQDWVAHFLSTYGSKIKAANSLQRKAYITYLDAAAAFHLGHYPRTVRLMEPMLNDLADVFFAIDARTILLRSHFENGNADSFEALCESFRLYLSRNSLISEGHKIHFNAFIKHFRRFIQIPPMDRSRMERLRGDLQKDRNVACHDWLMGKVNLAIERIPSSIQ